MKPAVLTSFLLCPAALFFMSACASTPSSERGPDDTIAYYVAIESDEPGVRIEADNNYVGETPCTLKVFGDKDGTFHNFGSYDYLIKATPKSSDKFVQYKKFRTGGWWTPEDRIPQKLFFDTRFQQPPQ
jgi:hypothetical protein